MKAEVLAVQNSDSGGPGLLAEWLSDAGVDLDIVRVFAGEKLPARVGAHGLLVLGGAPSPRDDDVAPWFPQVRALLAAAVEDHVPTLGICLGHQLLAMACGGDAGPASGGGEVGLHDIQIDRTAVAGDPLFESLPEFVPAVESHQDEVWELPAGAVALASTSNCRFQAFRIGPCAWGVQFHPEVTAPNYLGWARRGSPLPAAVGKDAVDLLVECEAAAPRLIATWSGFAGRFAQVVRQHAFRLGAEQHHRAWDPVAVTRSNDADPGSSREPAAARAVRS
jgi:GMP synthase-like glutamine amidotransferase